MKEKRFRYKLNSRQPKATAKPEASLLLEQVKVDIEDFLAANKSLFFNERDIQVTLALALKDKESDGKPFYDEVDMEYSLPLVELEERGLKIALGDYPWKNNMSVDLVVSKDGEYIPIELKYATRPIDKDIKRFGEDMLTDALIIKNQAASNLTMYNYWKDVRRIETLCRMFGAVKGGIALLITNNVTYWHEPQSTSAYRAFATTEGRTMTPGKKDWAGDISEKITATHPAFSLDGTYTCQWKDTAIDSLTAKGNERVPFRYLLNTITV